MDQVDIVGTKSSKTDISSSTSGYKELIDTVQDKGKEVWCTMCGQEWTRQAPFIESEDYLWAPEERLLRSAPHQYQPRLKSIYEQDINQYWLDYFK